MGIGTGARARTYLKYISFKPP